MQGGDGQKTPAPGNDSHVGHICNRCGWAFPNRHPSSKHRRAHKRVCGKVEGFTLISSEENYGKTQSGISDDELSDESSNKSGNKVEVARQISSRSEDEVFADAVSEFTDTSSSPIGAIGVTVGSGEAADAPAGNHLLEMTNDNEIPQQESPTNDDQFWSPDALLSRPVVKNVSVAAEMTDKDRFSDGTLLPQLCDVESKTPINDSKVNDDGSLPVVESVPNTSEGIEVHSKSHEVNGFAKAEFMSNPSTVGPIKVPEMVANLKNAQGQIDISSQQTPEYKSANESTEADSKSHEVNGFAKAEFMSNPSTVGPIKVPEMVVNLKNAQGQIDISSQQNPEYKSANESTEVDSKSHEILGFTEAEIISDLTTMDLTNTSSQDMVVNSVVVDDQLTSTRQENPESEASPSPDLGLTGGDAAALVQEGSTEADFMLDMDVEHNFPVGDVSTIKIEMEPNEPENIICDAKDGQSMPLGQQKSLNELPPSLSLVEIETSDAGSLLDTAQVSVNTLDTSSTEEVAVGDISEMKSEITKDQIPLQPEVSVDSDGVEATWKKEAPPASMPVQDNNSNVYETWGKSVKEESIHDDQSGINMGSMAEISVELLSDVDAGLTVDKEIMPDEELSSVSSDILHEKSQVESNESVDQDLSVGDTTDCIFISDTKINSLDSDVVSSETETQKDSLDNVMDEVDRNVQTDERTLLSTTVESKGQQIDSSLTENVSESKGQPMRGLCQDETCQESLQEVANVSCANLPVIETEVQVVDHKHEELVTSKVDTESSAQISVTHEDSRTIGFTEKDQCSLEEGGVTIPQQNGNASVLATDTSVDSISQTDSMEGYWGSVSDGTVQHLPGINAETPKEDSSDAYLNKTREDIDLFEAPSFMTLVEPSQAGNKQPPSSVNEIQLSQNSQKQTSSSHAGWFPSLADAPKESHGRKKNEEIIAKVVNWSPGKPHTPLRSLLVEANLEKKPHQPKLPTSEDHELVSQDNEGPASKATTSESSGKPSAEPQLSNIKREMEKEWNSPARLPISKTVKRKVRAKAYWVPFVCCSSVN